MFTDSMSLFDVITMTYLTAKKRLYIKFYSVRNVFDCNEFSNIEFVCTANSLTDIFTKLTTSPMLQKLSVKKFPYITIDQLVIHIKDFSRDQKTREC